MSESPIASRSEAVLMLGVSEKMVRIHEKNGRLPKASIHTTPGGLRRAFYPRAELAELKEELAMEVFTRLSEQEKTAAFEASLADPATRAEFRAREAAADELYFAELRAKREADSREAEALAKERERERATEERLAALRRQLRDQEREQHAQAQVDSAELVMQALTGLAAVATVAAAAWIGRKAPEPQPAPEVGGMSFAEGLQLMNRFVQRPETP